MSEKKERRIPRIVLPCWVLPLIMVVLGEVLLYLWTTEVFVFGRFAAIMAFTLGFGGILALLCSLLPGRWGKWISFTLGLLLLVLYMAEYLINDTFQTFMGFGTVQAGAGGVMTTYMSVVLAAIVNNIWKIILMALPLIAYGVFVKPGKTTWPVRGILAAAAAAMYVVAILVVNGVGLDKAKLKDAYNFDSAVRAFGLNTALCLDAFSGSTMTNMELEFELEEPVTETVTQPTIPEQLQPSENPEDATNPTTPAVVYEPHTLGLDFSQLAAGEPYANVAAMHQYVASMTPAMENAYTGLFAGKNLIFITAEAFSSAVIDPELTPTLYRLATKGIEFTDYYQPVWGAGTTGGEFVNLVGHIPVDGSCMKEANEQNLFLTLGKQLQALGYSSAAFHNNDHTFYDRHLTHTQLGYDYFMGYGNGIEAGVSGLWPQSDLEMMDYTVPLYIDQQPFSVYYMTVSGHSNYDLTNSMSEKNYDKVAHLDCSETVKCYIAANLELESAMASLVAQLEAAGIADDTVIVLTADHYPYGLAPSNTWGTDNGYLTELYGEEINDFSRDRNSLIIWSGDIEDTDITVDTPTYSLDILPTLSNLFGLPYDSRLFIGRDVFSESEPLVLWGMTGSWVTEKCSYLATTGTYIWADGVEPDDSYVQRINTIVRNKIRFSRGISYYDYFNYVYKALENGE